MTIYIDNEYKCYASESEGRRAFEVPFFDGKCEEFIEGYRFVPQDEVWTRSDGITFEGEMISPFKPYYELAMAQMQYELADMKTALETLGVTVDG